MTDECGDSGELDRQLDDFAGQLADAAATGYVQPPNFLAVAGRKLFRDAVWSSLRLVFRADHRYYRSHGLYDFPARSLKTRLSEGASLCCCDPPLSQGIPQADQGGDGEATGRSGRETVDVLLVARNLTDKAPMG